MPVFSWKARTVKGEMHDGELTAASPQEVIGYLRRKRLIVVSVNPKPKEIKLSLGGRVKTRDVVLFARQFATMINSGLPLVQCLSILSAQTENQKLKEITNSIRVDVEGGNTLADSMEKFPKLFTNLFVSMVRAGEAGGILDTIMLRLSEYMEKNDRIVRKIKGAMIYPAVVFTAAMGCVTVLLIFVIPIFSKMFKDMNMELPLPTMIIVNLSDFLIHFWWLLAGLIVGGIFALKAYKKTDKGELLFDSLMLKVPVLGNLIRKSAVARFTRTLGTLISSGVSILQGLEVTAKTSGNRGVHDAVMGSRTAIAGGETITKPLKEAQVFPPMVIQMINVGEQTGGLDAMLVKIADFYEEEVDTAVEALTAALEPIMIVFLGIIVGGMVVSMYLPIFELITKMH
ncbi:MAG: pilus assembly protein PilC [Candidatus Glassbacteria bacterium GWA2_58_10]|uniref:Pilus assembly protein PilC n=1 Tax=Candidatus Glassbacteria bacterium GWA2_58_10 TaxID=1817865 RepID=A0A1F5YFX6_9BACT|nr:MAG: pilus assembly protein PilC [Candidatus Glassbacteria bacterium GWA2_58_10]